MIVGARRTVSGITEARRLPGIFYSTAFKESELGCSPEGCVLTEPCGWKGTWKINEIRSSLWSGRKNENIAVQNGVHQRAHGWLNLDAKDQAAFYFCRLRGSDWSYRGDVIKTKRNPAVLLVSWHASSTWEQPDFYCLCVFLQPKRNKES